MADPTLSHSAIACATGGFKGAFIHGVLSAFEEAGVQASAYAAASSSVVPAAAAVAGRARQLGADHWQAGRRLVERPGVGMSEMVAAGIAGAVDSLALEELFAPGRPRFLVAANAVGAEAVDETQGSAARRRGRLLLLAAGRTDGQGRDWVDRHLTLHLFDSHGGDDGTTPLLPLSPANFPAVAYASSRMLHAWDVPAWVDGRAYVDAFYTCNCPALELVELGYSHVIALATEPELYGDIFRQTLVPEMWQGVPIDVIAPERDPAEMGVDYTRASATGLAALYAHGRQRGQAYLAGRG